MAAWVQVPEAIERAIEGLTDDGLDLRSGSNGWSIRETVHHLVEANLVASNIVIAALRRNHRRLRLVVGEPDGPWMERLGYNTAPVAPAIETLRALCRYISSLVAAGSGARSREVKLLDAPGAELRVMTVE